MRWEDDVGEVFGWRSRLRPGSEADYTRIHSRIPVAVAAALRSAGVVRWRIWRDGLTLFHEIETSDGRAAMNAAMARLGPIDPDWDALIATMVDDSPDSAASLLLVWGMDAAGQFDS